MTNADKGRYRHTKYRHLTQPGGHWKRCQGEVLSEEQVKSDWEEKRYIRQGNSTYKGKQIACMFIVLQFRGYSVSREVAGSIYGCAEIVCCNLYDVREFGL